MVILFINTFKINFHPSKSNRNWQRFCSISYPIESRGPWRIDWRLWHKLFHVLLGVQELGMAKIHNEHLFNRSAKQEVHTKPLVHRIPSTIPATNEAQFKLPKEDNLLFFICYHCVRSVPLSFGTVINLLTRHSRSTI